MWICRLFLAPNKVLQVRSSWVLMDFHVVSGAYKAPEALNSAERQDVQGRGALSG